MVPSSSLEDASATTNTRGDATEGLDLTDVAAILKRDFCAVGDLDIAETEAVVVSPIAFLGSGVVVAINSVFVVVAVVVLNIIVFEGGGDIVSSFSLNLLVVVSIVDEAVEYLFFAVVEVFVEASRPTDDPLFPNNNKSSFSNGALPFLMVSILSVSISGVGVN